MTKHTAPIIKHAGVEFSIRTMSVADWIKVLMNPRQRDHELRLDKRHLRQPHPAHAIVYMAELPDGSTYKLDGHTRAELFRRGSLMAPGAMLVVVYKVETIADVKTLYDAFDNRDATKTPQDTIQSASREYDIAFKTTWLRKGQFASAMNLAGDLMRKNAPRNNFDRVEFFKEELALFDSIEPSKPKFPIGIGAGALLFLRKHGKAALPFLRSYNKSLGVRAGNKRDAVVYLEEYLNGERKARALAGRVANTSNCAFALACMEASFSGLRQRAPSMRDLDGYVAKIS